IKLLAGEMQPLHGVIELSRGIKLGYFAQHQLETLHPEESALVHLARLAPRETEQQLRDYLGGFGFRGDKVTDPVAPFSGGEKARLVLALVVWQRPNLLLLDEPTNHLDLDMRQALTEALIDFEGAMVVVSHDRHLLRSTTDDLYLVHDGQVELFRGDLDDYQRWLSDQQRREQQEAQNGNSGGEDSAEKEQTNSAQARKDQKRRDAEFRQQTQPLRKKIMQLETRLEKLTEALNSIETQLGDSALYDARQKAKLSELLADQIKTKSELGDVEMGWMDAQEELEVLTQALNNASGTE
ncbi:MAG: ATP-binding cassette domain-containing protein, partial [Plesiomonas sp.]